MPEFVRVAKVSEIADPGKLIVEVDDRLVVLFHVEGNFWSIDDVCTHDGGPLGEGTLCGFEIACPRHGAKFDIRTGAALTMPATRSTVAHDVRVDGDDVLIRLNDA
jgi:3-phenylpropionate/trans-cinnamate dioxygenase ferredoxin subunit